MFFYSIFYMQKNIKERSELNFKIILYTLLFIFLAVLCYGFTLLVVDLKRRNFLSTFFDSFSKKYEERKIEQEAKLLYEGATDEKTIIENIDLLIQRSRIQLVFPFLTSELLMLITLLAAIFVSVTVFIYSKFLIVAIFAFIVVIAVAVISLQFMARNTFNKIDKVQLGYASVLKNLSISNSDIVVIFEKSIPYAPEPLKSYVEQFVFECKKGIPIRKAFRNFEGKIENKRFKQLIKNLDIASRHDANYAKVLDESRIIFKHYFAEKERRKKAVASGRAGIVLVIVVGCVVFKLLEAFTGDILTKLRESPAGNTLLFYFLLVFIYAIYKFVALDKLNY